MEVNRVGVVRSVANTRRYRFPSAPLEAVTPEHIQKHGDTNVVGLILARPRSVSHAGSGEADGAGGWFYREHRIHRGFDAGRAHHETGQALLAMVAEFKDIASDKNLGGDRPLFASTFTRVRDKLRLLARMD
jgi:hypothetical protein